jgi:hypothetical protein
VTVVTTTSDGVQRVARPFGLLDVSARTDEDGIVHVMVRDADRVYTLQGQPVVEIEQDHLVSLRGASSFRFALRIPHAEQLTVSVQPAVSASWWNVDHHDSDREYHDYCSDCYAQIPGFLVRWANPVSATAGRTCEGCGKGGDGEEFTRAWNCACGATGQMGNCGSCGTPRERGAVPVSERSARG